MYIIRSLSHKALAEQVMENDLLSSRPDIARLVLAGHTKFSDDGGKSYIALAGSRADTDAETDTHSPESAPTITRAAPLARPATPPVPAVSASNDLLAEVSRRAGVAPQLVALPRYEQAKAAPHDFSASTSLLDAVRSRLASDDDFTPGAA